MLKNAGPETDANSDSDGKQVQQNLLSLFAELDWLAKVIDQAIKTYLVQEGGDANWMDIEMPDCANKEGFYPKLVREWSLSQNERLALALCMAPHLKPELLDVFFGQNAIYGRGFTEFGGLSDTNFSGFLPTGQTLGFLICAGDHDRFPELLPILSTRSRLQTEQLVSLSPVAEGQPAISGALSMPEQWINYLITGEKIRPELNSNFPAHPISTPLQWSDLVLAPSVMSQVLELLAWLEHGDTLMEEWGLNKKVKPGFRSLFYGSPGTGKTLTASLLAKVSNREIYRVDLSMIVSKYIGETEKNLAKVFDTASKKNWILFFDEADALFGKRTAASNSNDRHANQQTGYLLQRIEDFPGVVILATNLRANMDQAFTRRFQSIVNFTMPDRELRYQLWKNAFDGSCDLAPDVDLAQLATDHELSGGSIINILRSSTLAAISRGSHEVSNEDLIQSTKRELRKENRTI